MITHSTLRAANVARQEEWAPGVTLSLAYKANELFGEAGEAANVIKKLERERLGIIGSRDTVEHLAEELADVVICVDLLAIAAGLNPVRAFATNVQPLNLTISGNKLGARAGAVCMAIEMGDYQEALPFALTGLMTEVRTLARSLGVDLDQAVADKFNATSEKVGLQTRLAA